MIPGGSGPETIAAQAVQEVARSGDVINVAKLERPIPYFRMAKGFGAAAMLAAMNVGELPLLNDTLAMAECWGLSALVLLVPYRFIRDAPERELLRDALAVQARARKAVGERVELLADGLHKPPTLLWSPHEKSDHADTYPERFAGLVQAFTAKDKPLDMILPRYVHDTLPPSDAGECDDTTLNEFLAQARGAATLGLQASDELPMVWLSGARSADIAQQVASHTEEPDEKLRKARGALVDFLLDSYANSRPAGPDNIGQKLVDEYRKRGDTKALRHQLRNELQDQLHDTISGVDRYQSAGKSRRRVGVQGHIMTDAVSVAMIDERGHYIETGNLGRLLNLPMDELQQRVETLLRESPTQGRHFIAAALYQTLIAKQFPDAHAHYHSASANDFTDADPSFQQRVAAHALGSFRGVPARSGTESTSGIKLLETPIVRIVGRSSLLFGTLLGLLAGSFIRSAKADWPAQVAHTAFAPFDAVNQTALSAIGITPPVKPNPSQAAALAANQAFASPTSISTGNVDTPDVAQWLIYRHGEGINATGYWADSAGDTFQGVRNGWGVADASPLAYLELKSPDYARSLPDTLRVTHDGFIQAGQEFAIPVRQNTGVISAEITDAKTHKPVAFEVDIGPLNQTYIHLKHPTNDPLDLSYWLINTYPNSWVHATHPLNFALGTDEDSPSVRAALRDQLARLDPDLYSFLATQPTLAKHLAHQFHYSFSPFTDKQNSQIFSGSQRSELARMQAYLDAAYQNHQENCNVAVTLLGAADYSFGVPYPLAVAGGYYNSGGKYASVLSSQEAHAFMVDKHGTIIDPTPAAQGPATKHEVIFSQKIRQELDAKRQQEPHAARADLFEYGGGALAVITTGVLLYLGRRKRTLFMQRYYRHLRENAAADPLTAPLIQSIKAFAYAPAARLHTMPPVSANVLADLGRARLPVLSHADLAPVLATHRQLFGLDATNNTRAVRRAAKRIIRIQGFAHRLPPDEN